MTDQFKPNIYPVIWWGLLYGVIFTLVLYILVLVAQHITVLWFPFFLLGLLYGSFRQYTKQRDIFYASKGQKVRGGSFMDEVKEAARDISDAGREVFHEEKEPVQTPKEDKKPKKPDDTTPEA